MAWNAINPQSAGGESPALGQDRGRLETGAKKGNHEDQRHRERRKARERD
ncbi:MAG: hypothetical protein ACK55I_21945 [bacterium]